MIDSKTTKQLDLEWRDITTWYKLQIKLKMQAIKAKF